MNRGQEDDDEDDDVASLHLTRLATSDLRNLELKYYDKWKAGAGASSSPAMTPTGKRQQYARRANLSVGSAQLQSHRRSLSSEDVSGINDGEDGDESSIVFDASNVSEHSVSSGRPSPHPQVIEVQVSRLGHRLKWRLDWRTSRRTLSDRKQKPYVRLLTLHFCVRALSRG